MLSSTDSSTVALVAAEVADIIRNAIQTQTWLDHDIVDAARLHPISLDDNDVRVALANEITERLRSFIIENVEMGADHAEIY